MSARLPCEPRGGRGGYGGIYTVPLTAVAVLLIGILLGRMSGLLYGTIGGLLIDITSGTLGMMTFFFMAVGFMIGLILYNPGEHLRSGRRVARKKRVQRGVWVFVLYAVGELTLFVIQYFNTAELRAEKIGKRLCFGRRRRGSV
mgnify:CR=1 FL=1